MSALGTGVLLDASVPPVRITAYDHTHADAQEDGSGDFLYDLHKTWSCMDRPGSNGIGRSGLYEEGNTLNAWPAGNIEEWRQIGGFQGFNHWNSLVPYNPVGGLSATLSYTIYGALAPFNGIAFHLGAPLASNPAIVVERWTGTIFDATPLTVTKTPDFSQANGRAIQRLEWTLPTTWTPTQLGTNPGQYYHLRVRVAADIPVAPETNTQYKDWLYGHFKFFYCHYGLKRGDDGTGTSPTLLKHEGNFGLKFRQTFGWETRVQQIDPITLGKRYPFAARASVGSPWYVYQAGSAAKTLNGVRLYGGMFCGRQNHDAVSAFSGFLGVAAAGEVADTIFSGAAPYNFGAAGSSSLELIENITAVKNPKNVAAQSVVGSINVGSATGRANDIKIAVQPGEGAINAYRSSVASPNIIGMTISDDDVSGLQVNHIGGGIMSLYDMNWGGPNNKAGGSSEIREYRRMTFLVRDRNLTTAPPAGMPVRITDALGTVRVTTTLDSSGNTVDPTTGIQNHMLIAERWLIGPVNEVLDELLTIEVNPSDMGGYNSAYATMVIKTRFPRKLMFDELSGDYIVMDWQRVDAEISFGLPYVCPDVPPAPPSVPVTVNDLPIEADAVLRILAPVPEAV